MRKLWMVLALAALLTAGCTDTGGDDAADDPTPAATTEASPGGSEDIQAGGECTDNSQVEGQADLELQDYQFAPPCLQINTGQGLRVHNEGSAAHNLSVEGFAGIDIDVQSGEENNTEATGLEPGTYTIFCKFHRESNDMEGELKVVES